MTRSPIKADKSISKSIGASLSQVIKTGGITSIFRFAVFMISSLVMVTTPVTCSFATNWLASVTVSSPLIALIFSAPVGVC